MTLKTSKNNSTILSRIGVGAFLVAALAATAPITFAGDGPKAEAPKAKTETKKVMKWVDNNDGVETSQHIEVIVEDGVTTIYSIDKDGNKTEIDASEMEMMEGIEGLDGMSVFVMDGMDGMMGEHKELIKELKGVHLKELKGGHKILIKELKELKELKGLKGDHIKHMEIMMGESGKHMLHLKDGGPSQIIIKRMSGGEDGTTIDIDNDVMFFGGEGNHAAAMVGAAQSLLDQAETMTGGKELSSKARKKIAKARKALKEAQEALEAEK